MIPGRDHGTYPVEACWQTVLNGGLQTSVAVTRVINAFEKLENSSIGGLARLSLSNVLHSNLNPKSSKKVQTCPERRILT